MTNLSRVSSGSSGKKRHMQVQELTREHLNQLEKEGTNTHTTGDEEDDVSADVFADLGSNILPWHRASITDTNNLTEQQRLDARLSTNKNPADNLLYKEISDLTKNVYDSFSQREAVLKTSYNNTRFYMIENFVEVEMLKYELLLNDLRNNSDLKMIENTDIKLTIDANANVNDLRDRKLEEIQTIWLMKILKASEDFSNKSKLVRSMFRRTHDFFNELNEMEYQYITKQHMREMSKQAILHKLRSTGDHPSPHLTERLNDVDTFQQKEIQNIKYNNLKEVYVRLMQKEWAAMDNHLNMLEALYQQLNGIYIHVMNMKIRHTHEWHAHREKSDKALQDVVHRLRESCGSEFDNRKDTERHGEMTQVKLFAEKDKEQRLKSFEDAQAVVSSELVFGITMKKNKNMYMVDDTSSDGTFDMDDSDLIDVKDPGKNEDFLRLIKSRIRIKASIESRYNELLEREVRAKNLEENRLLDMNRKKERDFLKKSMEKYFLKEKELETGIQKFLSSEKEEIDKLRKEQLRKLDIVISSHESYIDAIRLQTNLQTVDTDDLVSHCSAVTSEKRCDSHRPAGQGETMITAHVMHELRNALASILCLGQNLKEDPSSIESVVNEQSDICNYALEVCSDMIDIAKIKSADYQLQPSVVNLSKLFDMVIKLQGVRARPDVRVQKHMTSDPIFVMTEKKLLLQLLINLMSNSAKFTHSGSITMYCTIIKKAGVRYVKIGVADTGVGIRQELHDKINADNSSIKSFMETHSEVSKESAENIDFTLTEYSIRNSGYGLYLASTVAAVLGSSLKVVSPLVVNKCSGLPVVVNCPGSLFYILLPALENQNYPVSPPKPPKPQLPLPLPFLDEDDEEEEDSYRTERSQSLSSKHWHFCLQGTMKILVVDDQKLLRQSMAAIFRKFCEEFADFNVQIDTACSGEEAVRKVKVNDYDFISMDQFYDQTMLIKNTPIKEGAAADRRTLEMKSTTREENKAQFLDFFKTEEKFLILSTDGKLLGTEAITLIDALTRKKAHKTLVISCTGSDNVNFPFVLQKPYTVDNMKRLLEKNMVELLAKGIVHLENECMCMHDDLKLFKMRDIDTVE